MEYTCTKCGVTGVKLWREYQTCQTQLFCAPCALVDQKKEGPDRKAQRERIEQHRRNEIKIHGYASPSTVAQIELLDALEAMTAERDFFRAFDERLTADIEATQSDWLPGAGDPNKQPPPPSSSPLPELGDETYWKHH